MQTWFENGNILFGQQRYPTKQNKISYLILFTNLLT